MSCPECKSRNIAYTSTEGICKHCGLVIEDSFIEKPWNTSVTSLMPVDGRIVKAAWLISHKQKLMNNAWRKLNSYKTIGIPNYALKDAAKYYERCVDKKITLGRGGNIVLKACLFIACRNYSIPRTAAEFGNSKLILRTVKAVKKAGIKSKLLMPEDLISRYCEDVKKPLEILENLKKTSLITKNPKTVAALCVYLSDRVNMTKVCSDMGIHPATLRSVLREFNTISFLSK